MMTNMEPKFSEEKPMISARLGSGGRVSSGGTKRLSEFPVLSSSTSSSDEETTTTTDYYSYDNSVRSPGGDSVATNASDTSLSLKVDEFTNYRPLCSERSTSTHSQRSSAHSQRSSVSSANSRHRKKRVTDSGCVAGTNESARSYQRNNNNNNYVSDAGQEEASSEASDLSSQLPSKFAVAQRIRRSSTERQLKNESSFLDVNSGMALVSGGNSNNLVTVSSSIPVMNTVTVSSSSSSMQNMPQVTDSLDDQLYSIPAPLPKGLGELSETHQPVTRGKLGNRDLQVALPKGTATRLLRGRQQKPSELKAGESAILPPPNGPLRLRPLPKSFFQQPNRPSPIPPGISAFPLLPPLGDEQLTATTTNVTEDSSPKSQRRSTVYVGNIDLLHRLFDRVEQGKDRKSKASLVNGSSTCTIANPAASYQRKSRSNSLPRAPAACGKMRNADPYLLDNITERLFPELSLDQQDTLNSSLNSKTLTLPSLGSTEVVNYPQMLSELVAQI